MVYKNAQALSVKMKEAQEETAKDSCLMRIARYVNEGWPKRRDQVPVDANHIGRTKKSYQ